MGTSLVAALVMATALAAEPAPLSESQRSAVAELAKQSQSEAARLKQSLQDRQTELATAYASYTLDVTTIDRLEKEIVALQAEMLANYRQMQIELRKLVPEDRFERLRRRLDYALQHQPPTERAKDAPTEAEATEERVYSGPQAGEALTPFTVRGVFDEDAGNDLDFVAEADGKPIVLVFVHDVNRPSIALTRTLTSYTASRAKDGLTTGIVWLDADATEAENTLKRIRHALAPDARVGISPDGEEGPGAYGLNRNVTLTILVGNEGKVTANFALVQPSLQADLPKILDEVVRVAGGTAPPLEKLAGAMRPAAGDADMDTLRGLLRPVIQRDASAEEVDRAAKALEEYVTAETAARREVGRIANTIINAGKLSDYGTPAAQRYLEKWAKEYGEPQSPETDERQP
jgi:hypothetical protein